jgi:hypothetical protein
MSVPVESQILSFDGVCRPGLAAYTTLLSGLSTPKLTRITVAYVNRSARKPRDFLTTDCTDFTDFQGQDTQP